MTDAARFKSRPVESPIEAQRSNSTPVEALEKAKGGISRPRSLTSSPQTEVIKITLSKSRATGDRSAGLSIGVPTEHTMSEHTQQTATQDDAQFQITESDLKADLRRVKLELGETPSYGDYDQHGAYSFTPIRRVFGCWSNALAAVGFDTNDRAANAAYTDEELLDAIRELAAEVEGAPTARDMNNHGRHSNQIYYNRFGSWTAALSKAGVEKKDNYVSAGSLINAILDVACQVGRSPYGREFDELTDHSQATCKNRFGSWAEALRMAGLPPRYRGGNSTKHQRHGSYGHNWREMRRRALERDRYECQDCGVEYAAEKEQTGNGLHVHHICPIRAFDEPEQANFLVNLISLCEECHQKWERSGPTQEEIEEIVGVIEAGGSDDE